MKWTLLILIQAAHLTEAKPHSKPYIPFRTNPYDQPVDHSIDLPDDRTKSNIHQHDVVDPSQCPLQFTLGIAKTLHRGKNEGNSIHRPPVIHPVFPVKGPGKQIIYTTQYENLELLTPATLQTPGETIKEAIIQAPDFPLLMESSSFHASPIIYDTNGDGIEDAILVDYDGGIYFVGLAGSTRYFHRTQVPRLHVRKNWIETLINQTLGLQNNETDDVYQHEPYHSYFEYLYTSDKKSDVLRGVSANLIDQDHDAIKAMRDRKTKRLDHKRPEPEPKVEDGVTSKEENEDSFAKHAAGGENPLRGGESVEVDKSGHEKNETKDANIDESAQVIEGQNKSISAEGLEETTSSGHHSNETKDEDPNLKMDNEVLDHGESVDRTRRMLQEEGGDASLDEGTDDAAASESEDIVKDIDDYVPPTDDFDQDMAEDVGPNTDDFRKEDLDQDYYDGYKEMYPDHDMDDLYGYHGSHGSDFYDSKHYIRITPHVLTDSVIAEIPRQYSNNNEMDSILFVPVSYYFDEDEYDGLFSYARFENGDTGDETELKRGQYVASALLGYIVGDGSRWSTQEHLDLTSDFTGSENITLVGSLPLLKDSTRMGAFAMAPPTVADLDGNGSLDIIIPTSMGVVYCFEARMMIKRDNWPIQLRYPIEHRAVVEDVVGDTNLEIFVSDIVGNIICLSHDGKKIWYRSTRSILGGAQVRGSSPMVLGDVNGDGRLDLIIVIESDNEVLIFAFDAATGKDITRFPMKIGAHPHDSLEDEDLHTKLPLPLLVDLHTTGYQKRIEDFVRRNGTAWTDPSREQAKMTSNPPHGGRGSGLHIVYPLGEDIIIVEAGSGCTQKVSVGDNVTAGVQVEDVHGTGMLDLVVSTKSGEIFTLETLAPYHPLNTWTHGETRGLTNSYAHGYSASQGVFVHQVSRQFVDVFGVFIPITFEIFDNRPGISGNPDRRKYTIEVRAGTSWKRTVFRKEYSTPGVYTEQIFPRFGPGYYSLNVILRTSHGLQYEDVFSIGYNVNYMEGFGLMLILPLLIAVMIIMVCGVKKPRWDDDDFDGDRHNGLGILGRSLPA